MDFVADGPYRSIEVHGSGTEEGAFHMVARDTTIYQKVLAQARDLAPDDKLRLVKTLAAQLRDDLARDKSHHVREFRGIGRASWDGSDAQEYVNRERDAWDGLR